MVDYGAARARARALALAPRRSLPAKARADSALRRRRVFLALRAAGTDQLLLDIADYVVSYELEAPESLQTARYALLDSIGALAHVCMRRIRRVVCA